MTYLLADDFYDSLVAAHGTAGGAYVIRAVDVSGQYVSIHRVLGTDPEGILYIGQGDQFEKRVAFLSHTLRTAGIKGKHTFAQRYHDHPLLVKAFPADRLVIDLHPSEDPVGAERARLETYFQSYGETPPLNRNS